MCSRSLNRGRCLGLAVALLVSCAILAGRPQSSSAQTTADGKIAFNALQQIFVMNADGSGRTPLNVWGSAPHWSPDGDKILFICSRGSRGGDSREICVMNADGSGVTKLTDNSDYDGFATWSPDGSKIAFVSMRDGNLEIYAMEADGSQQRNLTNNPAQDINPAWSPDSTKIAFDSGYRVSDDGASVTGAGSQPEGFYDSHEWDEELYPALPHLKDTSWGVLANRVDGIYVMNTDGSDQTRIIRDEDIEFSGARAPAWSPDGTRIAFEGGSWAFDIYIYIANADGSGLTRVSQWRNDHTPTWSPDGKKIAFVRSTDSDAEIYVLDLASGLPTRLTDNRIEELYPAWQRLPGAPPLTPTSALQFSRSIYSAREDNGAAILTVTRLGDLSGEATINYSTADGTASHRSDYIATSGTLRFAAGEASQNISISIVDDPFIEPPDALTVTLSDPTGAALNFPRVATLDIVSNDSPPSYYHLIDVPEFFVGQHYFDFLGRDPDVEGFDFWTREITSCGGNSGCVEIKRINVSAAFFLSGEFQETGYFVYRMEKAAFGHRPRFEPFLADKEKVGQGVVVGQGDWQARLQANQRAFADEYVARVAFVEKYPASLSAEEYVNTLDANTGAVLNATEREALIEGLQSGAETRASILRQVAENAEFKRRERNPAFVLMEYFVYLRRNPDDAGYEFWLKKLNNHNGNYIAAEMVKAFITSGEYRQRFGN
jgi:Tol biopolymer transport system component